MLISVSAEPYGVCVLSCFSCVQLCASLFTEARQASLSMGILQARILEWVAMPFSKESARPRDWTQVTCIARHWPSKPPGRPPANLLEWLFILATMEMYGSYLLSRQNLLRGARSAGSLLLQPLWDTFSFPTTVILFGSWAFLASTGPLLGHSVPSFLNLPTSPSFTSEPSLMVWELFLPSAHTSHYLSEVWFWTHFIFLTLAWHLIPRGPNQHRCLFPFAM